MWTIDFPEVCSPSFGTWTSGIPEPVERELQAFFERDRRFVTEQRLRLRNVRLGIADVAGARLLVDGLHVRSDDAVHDAHEIVQRDPTGRGDVDDFAACLWRLAGPEHAVADVGDGREV